jgi:hypothetical protein
MTSGTRAALIALAMLGSASAFAGCNKGGDMAILDVDPKVGHTQGEQPIRILGQNFRQDIGYTVYFGSKKAGSVTILDSETLLVSTPTGVGVGPVDISIRADDGNAFKVTQAFKFEDQGGGGPNGVGGDGASGKKKGNLAY